MIEIRIRYIVRNQNELDWLHNKKLIPDSVYFPANINIFPIQVYNDTSGFSKYCSCICEDKNCAYYVQNDCPSFSRKRIDTESIFNRTNKLERILK